MNTLAVSATLWFKVLMQWTQPGLVHFPRHKTGECIGAICDTGWLTVGCNLTLKSSWKEMPPSRTAKNLAVSLYVTHNATITRFLCSEETAAKSEVHWVIRDHLRNVRNTVCLQFPRSFQDPCWARPWWRVFGQSKPKLWFCWSHW